MTKRDLSVGPTDQREGVSLSMRKINGTHLYKVISKENIQESTDGCKPLIDSLFFTTDRTIGRSAALIQEATGRFMPPGSAAGERSFRFVRPHQTHSDRILRITEDLFSLSETEREQQLEGIDAVISDVRNACIGISTADCIPVLVHDSAHHAAAAIHAGWRGTAKRIVEKTIKEMCRTFGTDPEKCHAVIGPGISQESFEVGWEVHEAFTQAGFPMQDFTVVLPSNDGNGTKPHLDLKGLNRLQLLASGLLPENIETSPIDTFTDLRFFSARREQKGDAKCGRILSGFILFQ